MGPFQKHCRLLNSGPYILIRQQHGQGHERSAKLDMKIVCTFKFASFQKQEIYPSCTLHVQILFAYFLKIWTRYSLFLRCLYDVVLFWESFHIIGRYSPKRKLTTILTRGAQKSTVRDKLNYTAALWLLFWTCGLGKRVGLRHNSCFETALSRFKQCHN